MKVTNINICPVQQKDGLLAFTDFLLDDYFFVGGVAIISRPNGGIRLVYPTRKIHDKNIPICNPISQHLGNFIEQEVSKKYEQFRELYINKAVS